MLFAADVEHDGLSRMSRSPLSRSDRCSQSASSWGGELIELMTGWHQCIPSMPYFRQAAIIPINTLPTAVLDAYKSEGSTVLRTDHDGGIWFTGGVLTTVLHVHRARELVWQPTNSASCLWACETGKLGSGYGNNGVTVIDRCLAGYDRPMSYRTTIADSLVENLDA